MFRIEKVSEVQRSTQELLGTLHFNSIFSCHLLFEQRVKKLEFDKCIKARPSRVARAL